MKTIFLVAILLLNSFSTFSQIKEPKNKKVLIVVSSYGKDNGKTRPGFEMDEFTQAYYIFLDNNISVDVASPKGGKVTADEFNPKKLYNKRYLEDKKAQQLLNNTLSTASLVNATYDAIYIMGGKGAMFDLPVDPSLQEIILKIYNNNGVVSSVCHGSAAFVNIKNGNEFIVKDKEITGFCNTEEDKFGKVWKKEFPFLLEDKLIIRGAHFKKGEDMLPFVISSEKFITGQNPYSTSLVAEEILKKLSIQPKSRILYPDEKSMLLVKKAINGEFEWAKSELLQNKSSYEIELIGVYGYYGLLYERKF